MAAAPESHPSPAPQPPARPALVPRHYRYIPLHSRYITSAGAKGAPAHLSSPLAPDSRPRLCPGLCPGLCFGLCRPRSPGWRRSGGLRARSSCRSAPLRSAPLRSSHHAEARGSRLEAEAHAALGPSGQAAATLPLQAKLLPAPARTKGGDADTALPFDPLDAALEAPQLLLTLTPNP